MMIPTTVFQKHIAKKLGISIDESSFAVAATQIEIAIAPALSQNPKKNDGPATQRQIEYAKSLGIDVSQDCLAVARSRIVDALYERNTTLIRKYGLCPGSKVRWLRYDRIMEISSIADNLRLWFKGGNGWGAFPTEIEPVKK